MDDRTRETSQFGVFWVYVQRIRIAIQSVEDGLVGEGTGSELSISFSLGQVRNGLQFPS